MSINTDNKQVAKNMTDRVIDEIQHEIENEMIHVNSKQASVDSLIKEDQGKRKGRKRSHEPTIEDLHEVKQSKIMELREIQRQEDMLKKSSVINKSHVSKSCTKLWKSEFTEQEMNEIKKIKKKQKQYEKQLKLKEQNLQKWQKEKKKEDEELKKQFLNEQCEQRRKQLTKQRDELQKKRKERVFQIEQEIRKIKELKTKKLLHNRMSQSWKKYEQSKENERASLWQLQKEKRRVNSKEIRQHQAKYLQIKEQNDRKRLQESRASKFHLPYIHPHSQTYKNMQKNEEQRIKQQEMKARQLQNNIIKRKQYSKHVNEAYLPKVSSGSLQKKEKTSLKTLNVEQSYKLGNEYMKSVHKKVTNDLIHKQKKSLVISEQHGGNSVFYKNYLQEIKSEHHKENQPSLTEAVGETMKNTKLSDLDKLHKVKMIFERDNTKRSDTTIVETIKNKIKVLQEIMQ